MFRLKVAANAKLRQVRHAYIAEANFEGLLCPLRLLSSYNQVRINAAEKHANHVRIQYRQALE